MWKEPQADAQTNKMNGNEPEIGGCHDPDAGGTFNGWSGADQLLSGDK